MKILTLDIETSPNLAHVWGLWKQDIRGPQLLESTEMLCFAAKWLGSKSVLFASQFTEGRGSMVRAAHDLLSEADALITYNGKRFDTPHLNREFVQLGLKPPSPFKQIDLIDTVKSKFKFPSNSLAYVLKTLGLGGKLSHTGHQLWIDCLAGDAKAWKLMERYNKQDVIRTEQLYKYLLPWINGHPSFGAETGNDVCPNCGSDNLHRQGFTYTPTGRYQRYVCECGRWSRATRRDQGTQIAGVAAS